MSDLAFTAWGWWIVAGALLIIEMAAPGFVFLWLAIAGVLTGGLVWLLPELGWQIQLLAFAALALLSVVAWTRLRAASPAAADDSALNRRAEALIGQRFVLVAPIAQGRGRVRVGDSSWAVSGPDLPAGAVVRVVGADGSRLLVEPAPPADG